MKRYIDADELICTFDGSECLDTERDYEEVARRIEECETVDVEEVKHGEWISDGWNTVCSACGKGKWQGYIPTPDNAKKWMPRCPQCGARMDGKEKTDGET